MPGPRTLDGHPAGNVGPRLHDGTPLGNCSARERTHDLTAGEEAIEEEKDKTRLWRRVVKIGDRLHALGGDAIEAKQWPSDVDAALDVCEAALVSLETSREATEDRVRRAQAETEEFRRRLATAEAVIAKDLEISRHAQAETEELRRLLTPAPEGLVKAMVKRLEPDPECVKFVVVGGAEKGILVRIGADLKSAELRTRLKKGAVIHQMERQGERLHYKKLEGDGPDFGWVSFSCRNHRLLEPAD
eukprot:gnl/TRDRNA2_/TRDRNA2_157663_c0_seq1.p1 gnl/TRDRNA2_/TRDRNA2_157663_c0~~gnl/TRDRNA2_/TRDRNA2_157663_c0_seq1.p1  ORF type:complete len:245 (+),score=58.43 gnl/TRDRNA2_/TRDRNA2_157663_c0_seq1:22-756(+)